MKTVLNVQVVNAHNEGNNTTLPETHEDNHGGWSAVVQQCLQCNVCYIIPFDKPFYGHNLLLKIYALFLIVSKGMWAVKLCTNKILQFLPEGSG